MFSKKQMIIFMQKKSKQFKYMGNYRHSLGGDDFALLPCIYLPESRYLQILQPTKIYLVEHQTNFLRSAALLWMLRGCVLQSRFKMKVPAVARLYCSTAFCNQIVRAANILGIQSSKYDQTSAIFFCVMVPCISVLQIQPK